MLNKFYNLPIFSMSFRVLFILAALLAIIVVTLWVSMDFNYLSFYSQIFTASKWHGHEMVFGFSLALLIGFILTASSHWSGKPAFKGLPIVVLSVLWCLERVLCVVPIDFWPFFILTSFFLPYSILLLHIQLGDNTKNRLIFIPIFIVFFITQKVFHLSLYYDEIKWSNISLDWAINLTKLIVIIVSGRIVPFFVKKKYPEITITIPSIINSFCIYPLFFLFIPNELIRIPNFFMAINFILLFANSIRFILWAPYKTYKTPVLLILHSGQFWLLIVFILDGLSFIFPEIKYTKAPLYAFGAGVLGVFAIGMMNRVSLGHTGRVIKASKLMIAAYVCVHLGALIRVFTPIFTPIYHRESLHHSAGWWTLGFIFFLIEFTKTLMTKRPDGKD